MNDVNRDSAPDPLALEQWRQALGDEVPVIDWAGTGAVVDPLADAAQPEVAPAVLMLAGDPMAQKQRAALRHEAVFVRAGWTRVVDSMTVTYAPPAGATPAEIAATEDEARRVRVRDGWVSER